MHWGALLRKEDSSAAVCAAAAWKATRKRAKKARQKAGAAAGANSGNTTGLAAAEELPPIAASRINAPDVAHAATPKSSSDPEAAEIEFLAGPPQSICAAALLPDTDIPEWQLCALTSVRVTKSHTTLFSCTSLHCPVAVCVASFSFPSACNPCLLVLESLSRRRLAMSCGMIPIRTHCFQLSRRSCAHARLYERVATDRIRVYGWSNLLSHRRSVERVSQPMCRHETSEVERTGGR